MQFRTLSFAVALFTGGTLAGAAITVPVMAGQPHMQAALRALQNAKAQLQAAVPDKGGHRVNAISLVNQAIDQVNQGIGAGQ